MSHARDLCKKVNHHEWTCITKTRLKEEKTYHFLDMIDNVLGWNTAVLLEQVSCLDRQIFDVRIIPRFAKVYLFGWQSSIVKGNVRSHIRQANRVVQTEIL